MEVILLVALILINALFAMSELALVTARKARLARLASEGDGAAAAALRLAEDPNRFLSTIQIGITSIGILSGIVGEAVLAAPLSAWLVSLGLEEAYTSVAATALVVVVVTYVSIVIGELVPKRIGQIHPEAIARAVARPMESLAAMTRPFVRLLSFSTAAVLRVLGLHHARDDGVTQEEIHALLEQGSESGVIEQQEHDLVRNVFRLDDRQIGSLMIPRADVEYVEVTLPVEENLRRLAESDYARFPVCRDGFHRVLGVLQAKKALAAAYRGEAPDLTRDLQPAVFVPETLTGVELLENFRSQGMAMAFVVDEYGEIQGIVTMHDLLEALTGEFRPRHAEDAWAVRRHDGSWLLDGGIPIPDLKDRLGIAAVPEEDKGRYQTLSGLVMLLLGRVPATGDRVEWDRWLLEVVDMDERRIDKVLATPVVPAPTADAGRTPAGDDEDDGPRGTTSG